jgi:hypothetical protein
MAQKAPQAQPMMKLRQKNQSTSQKHRRFYQGMTPSETNEKQFRKGAHNWNALTILS